MWDYVEEPAQSRGHWSGCSVFGERKPAGITVTGTDTFTKINSDWSVTLKERSTPLAIGVAILDRATHSDE